MLADGRWSQKYESCKNCGTTTVKHKSYGYCMDCHKSSPENIRDHKKSSLLNREKINARAKARSAELPFRTWSNEKRIESYERNFNMRFDGKREEVFKTYGNACLECGKTRAESKLKHIRDIQIIHIDGNKKNNNLSNLRPLCQQCFMNRISPRRPDNMLPDL